MMQMIGRLEIEHEENHFSIHRMEGDTHIQTADVFVDAQVPHLSLVIGKPMQIAYWNGKIQKALLTELICSDSEHYQ